MIYDFEIIKITTFMQESAQMMNLGTICNTAWGLQAFLAMIQVIYLSFETRNMQRKYNLIVNL